ncbi:DUF2637 domain-containing protein [Streptomyces sp. NBC_01356]
MAGVAAYASCVHQREFALRGGADTVSASLWPLSVDRLLLLATVGLLKPTALHSRRARGAVWAVFSLGIAVSLGGEYRGGAGSGVAAGPCRRMASHRVTAVGGTYGAPPGRPRS